MNELVLFLGLLSVALIFEQVATTEVTITRRLAGGICSQFKTWKQTKELQPPLKSAKRQLDKSATCSMLQRTDCGDNADCTPFRCESSTHSGVHTHGDDDNEVESSGESHVAAESRARQNIPPGYPGSRYGNPNNPKNLTVLPCVSTDNPYNKWPNKKKKKRQAIVEGGRDPGEGVSNDVEEEDEIADAELPGDGLLEYLQSNKPSKKQSRIIGGKNSTDNLFPYAVRIAFCRKWCYWDHTDKKQNDLFSKRSESWEEQRRCTGVIMNKWYVLTSASCGRWLNEYRVAYGGALTPNITRNDNFTCGPYDYYCPQIPESYEELVNLTDIFLYFGSFTASGGNLRNRERRSMRSVTVACETQAESPYQQYDEWGIVELFARLVYKKPSFWPLYLSDPERQVTDVREGSPTKGKKVKEGRPFFAKNGKIRGLFIGWGNTNADKLDWSNYLKFIRMNAIPGTDPTCFNYLATRFYIAQDEIRNEFFCAKFDESETSTQNALCRGDVGGPFICETETGLERMCGLLTTSNITGTFDSDRGTCNPTYDLYPFRNMTTGRNRRAIFNAIGKSGGGHQAGYIYRSKNDSGSGKPLHDEDETAGFTNQRSFETVWNAAGVPPGGGGGD